MITELFSGLDWAADAPCSQVDPDLFFPDRSAGSNASIRVQVAEAQRVCASCPFTMRRRCAGRALDGDDRYGVWAGVYVQAHHPMDRVLAVAELQRIAGRVS